MPVGQDHYACFALLRACLPLAPVHTHLDTSDTHALIRTHIAVEERQANLAAALARCSTLSLALKAKAAAELEPVGLASQDTVPVPTGQVRSAGETRGGIAGSAGAARSAGGLETDPLSLAFGMTNAFGMHGVRAGQEPDAEESLQVFVWHTSTVLLFRCCVRARLGWCMLPLCILLVCCLHACHTHYTCPVSTTLDTRPRTHPLAHSHTHSITPTHKHTTTHIHTHTHTGTARGVSGSGARVGSCA